MTKYRGVRVTTGDSYGASRTDADRTDRAWLREQVAATPPPPHRTQVLWTRAVGPQRVDRFQAWCVTCGWVSAESGDKASLQAAATMHEAAPDLLAAAEKEAAMTTPTDRAKRDTHDAARWRAYFEAERALDEAERTFDERVRTFDEAERALDEAERTFDERVRTFDEAERALDEAERVREP